MNCADALFHIRPIKKRFLFSIICLEKNLGGGGIFFYILYPVFGGIDSSGSIDYLQTCYTLFSLVLVPLLVGNRIVDTLALV